MLTRHFFLGLAPSLTPPYTRYPWLRNRVFFCFIGRRDSSAPCVPRSFPCLFLRPPSFKYTWPPPLSFGLPLARPRCCGVVFFFLPFLLYAEAQVLGGGGAAFGYPAFFRRFLGLGVFAFVKRPFFFSIPPPSPCSAPFLVGSPVAFFFQPFFAVLRAC